MINNYDSIIRTVKELFSKNIKNSNELSNLIDKYFIPHILLSARKITHNLCNDSLFQWIPYVPLNLEWNDKKIFEYFKMNDTLIKLINSIRIDGTFNSCRDLDL